MLLTLDDVAYTAKPDRAEFARITSRMKAAQPRETDRHGFCAHIAQGKTWIGGAFDNGLKTLKSWQLAALDFDNGTLSPVATIENPRFRMVFMLDQPLTAEKQARDCISALLSVFPEADKQCVNPNRIFLGSQGEVWPVFEVVCL